MKKFSWLVLSSLLVVALLVTACQPAPQTTSPTSVTGSVVQPTGSTTPVKPSTTPATTQVAPTSNTVNVTLTKLDGTKITKQIEKPQYGGTIVTCSPQYTENLDPRGPGSFPDPTVQYNVYETMTIADWTRGPAGTNEDPDFDTRVSEEYWVPWLAESFEMPNNRTMIYHLRSGIRFQNKAPANGRLVTADDIVASILGCAAVAGGSQIKTALGDKVYAKDKSTVVIEKAQILLAPIRNLCWLQFIYPPEIVNATTNKVDWRNVVGTGPYMLTDYIGGTSITLTKNKEYWGHSLLFPDDQLPYADTIKSLIIVDSATRLAAIRTGRIDRIAQLSFDESEQLTRTTPDLLKSSVSGAGCLVEFRADKKPMDNIDVRRALIMAIDRKTILKDYLHDQGQLDWWPLDASSVKTYTPLDQQPKELQELFEYNPDKARQLLKDAGYGSGFTLDVLYGDRTSFKDYFLLIQDAWSKIGVTANGRFMPWAASSAEGYARNYDIYFWEQGGGGRQGDQVFAQGQTTWASNARFSYWWGVDAKGVPAYTDPVGDEWLKKCSEAAYPDPGYKVQKDTAIYFASKVFNFGMPRPKQFIRWWPWLKGYYGELAAGQTMTFEGIYSHCWVDQTLKTKMTK